MSVICDICIKDYQSKVLYNERISFEYGRHPWVSSDTCRGFQFEFRLVWLGTWLLPTTRFRTSSQELLSLKCASCALRTKQVLVFGSFGTPYCNDHI